VPDFSILGYLLGNQKGAWIYNLFHHRGFALLLYAVGVYTLQPTLQLIGVMLFSHSSFDRMLGYGLKYEQGFKYTHLGKIGKEKE